MIQDYEQRLARLGLGVPNVLIPSADVDLERWAVIACDQFTSDPAYWDRVESIVDGSPSTLRLMLPERYLEEPGREERLASAKSAMSEYLSRGILRRLEQGFMLVRRQTHRAEPRWGLIAMLDLDHYDYRVVSKSLIRATEGTIAERIPPRTLIRDGAPIELPHIMVLYDDPEFSVVGPYLDRASRVEPTYSTGLMLDGGQVAGYHLRRDEEVSHITEAFERLEAAARTKQSGSEGPLLFAVGDGNHSLAAAKSVWERARSLPGCPAGHPARFALVELVNIHDRGLHFEPIHRVIFSEGDRFFDELAASDHVERERVSGIKDILNRLGPGEGGHTIGAVSSHGSWMIRFKSPASTIAVGTLQPLIDEFLAKNPRASVDYIHGESDAERLGAKPGNLGLLFPKIDKHGFFEAIFRNGSFPRKTFSMGEAEEKRYYLECRRLFPLAGEQL